MSNSFFALQLKWKSISEWTETQQMAKYKKKIKGKALAFFLFRSPQTTIEKVTLNSTELQRSKAT